MADQGVVLPALEWFRNTIGRTEQVLSWLKLAQEAGPSPQTDSGSSILYYAYSSTYASDGTAVVCIYVVAGISYLSYILRNKA
ncbi:hypothetical protein RRG08_025174 [Elysia crispata]|uniref:Uncharacterized protein n=1 Tax=Elysia crispata TaxID=231223 RepID=A0AAE0ZBC1_9GAST|nr:hypothetical protein RRG08_025174 [Elysia crispata]